MIEVDSYTEAAGVLLALKKGISVESLYRPLRTLDHERAAEALAHPASVAEIPHKSSSSAGSVRPDPS